MNNPHTPGPWHCQPAQERGFTVFIGPKHAANDVLLIGSSGGNLQTVTQDKANAHLIAAAPELLNALEIAVVTIQRLAKTDSAKGTLDVAYTAISKAKGDRY